jgi:NTP pyrophosphatase (non-canonical NTP hydrolase)
VSPGFSDDQQHMTADEYAAFTDTTDIYPGAAWYYALGLAGETGEAVDKLKKLYRDKSFGDTGAMSPEDRQALLLELGDVLWYLTRIARIVLKGSLVEVMEANAEKLISRKQRGVSRGEGDNR